MNVQELVINLKVISSIGVNQKLNTKNIILNVEPLSVIPEFARRWLRQDNREETIRRITEVVDQSIKYFNEHGNNNVNNKNMITNMQTSVYYDCDESNGQQVSSRMKSRSESNEMQIVNMTKYLIDSKKGLDNLKKTYSSCMMTVAKIDWVIDKINDTLKERVMEV